MTDYPHPETAAERLQRLQVFWLAAPPEPLEALFGVLKVAWGSWWLLCPGSFAASPASHRLMAEFMPQWGWGLLMVVQGLGRLAALYLDDVRLRYRLAMLGCFWWFGLGFIMWLSDHHTPALAVQGVLAAFSIKTASWIYQRLPDKRSKHPNLSINTGGENADPVSPASADREE